ncbi:MAG: YceI family protein [Salibacteraceae bacterium]
MTRILVWAFLLLAQTTLAQSKGQLIIFTQSDKPISQHFERESLPKIQQYAQERGLQIIRKEVKDGAPEEVTLTPQIIFQNHLGRSIYRGRYLTIDRLTNFIRTVTNAPQGIATNPVTQYPITEIGRTMVGAPIKITNLEGALPELFDAAAFEKEARTALAQGFKQLQVKANFDLPTRARLFYMDYHPYLGEDGQFYLSAKLFSMFSCAKEVYATETAFKGSWQNREAVFQEAAARMEGIAFAQLKNLKVGDAFETIPGDVPVKSWETLGLNLPSAPNNKILAADLKGKLPNYWNFEKALPDGSPIIQFNFGAPVDHYAGEVRQLNMHLALAKGQQLQGATGFVVVNANSVTMGDAVLDDHIFNDYLHTANFPKASYEFKITKAPAKWAIEEPQNIELEGTFTMVGKSIPLTAKGRIAAIADPDGTPRLQVNGQFLLPLKEGFGISGPDGPSPAKDELQFYINLILEPGKKSEKMADTSFKMETAEASSNTNVEAEEGASTHFLKWFAASPMYKAKGTFEDWEVTHFEMPNGDVEQMQAEVSVTMNSVWERSKLLVKHLKEEDYLDVSNYSTASVVVNHVVEEGNGLFRADALVTLLGISQTVPLYFKVVSYAPFTVEGTAMLNRSDFGVGKGGKSKSIKEEVEIQFYWSLPNS